MQRREFSLHITVQVAMSWVMSQSQASSSFKVVLLGEGIYLGRHSSFFYSVYLGCVGKSSIVLRYVDDKFNTGHLTTLQVCSPRYHVQASIGVRHVLSGNMRQAGLSCNTVGRLHDEETGCDEHPGEPLHLGHGRPGEVPCPRPNLLQRRSGYKALMH